MAKFYVGKKWVKYFYSTGLWVQIKFSPTLLFTSDFWQKGGGNNKIVNEMLSTISNFCGLILAWLPLWFYSLFIIVWII